MANLTIEIRSKRVPGGRLSISSGTTSKRLRDDRKASLRKVLDRGMVEVVDLLRSRKLHISEVDAAVRDGDYERLRAKMEHAAGPLGPACDTFLAMVESTREPKTHKQVEFQVNALLRHFPPSRALESITRDEAQAFLAVSSLTGGPWSATAQGQARGTYRRIWSMAGARTDPWKDVQLPRKRVKRVVFLSPEQWKKYAAENWGTPDLTAAALGCLAGLRVGEVSQLRPGIDVDLEARKIRIQPRAGEYAWKPKTDNSVRDVPIGDELHSILKAHVDVGFAGERYFLHHPGMDKPIGIDQLADWFARGCKRAGIVYGRDKTGITFHTLRHTFASWLAQRDVQLMKISLLLGDTVEVVAQTYAHLLPSDLERAVLVIDDVLRTK